MLIQIYFKLFECRMYLNINLVVINTFSEIKQLLGHMSLARWLIEDQYFPELILTNNKKHNSNIPHECSRLLKIRQYKRIPRKLKLGLLAAFRLSLMSFSDNRFGHLNLYLEFSNKR